MKLTFLFFLLFVAMTGISQTQFSYEDISTAQVKEFEDRGFVQYSDFGAIGDGKTDDIAAIARTHFYANKSNLSVKADEEATYYIGEKAETVIIQTDTDFSSAVFTIDDTKVENIKAPIFQVLSKLNPIELSGISTLKRNQEKVDVSLPGSCLITVTNSNVKHYIRYGLNQNNGASQTDIFVVDEKGNVDMNAPIIWDFDEITEVKAIPVDKETLYIRGGSFTTIANQAESKYTYYGRNIEIKRSNVVVDGLEHKVKDEKDHGAPYRGFINVIDCSYVTIMNTVLTGHKTYKTIGAAGKPVSMGSYDISVSRALNVSFINCSQTNDINDKTYWGIMGSNYSKNMLLDGCKFSRFDAHKGVANATVRNSTLGHMGINAIGSGLFTVENTTIRGKSLINLRSDYGSTWEGEFVIRNCVFVPYGGEECDSVRIVSGQYTGQHDFGYTCYMPEKITIENLKIDDSQHSLEYKGPVIFQNFNKKMKDTAYIEQFPYVKTNMVTLKNVSTTSGKEIRISSHPFMFNDVEVRRK